LIAFRIVLPAFCASHDGDLALAIYISIGEKRPKLEVWIVFSLPEKTRQMVRWLVDAKGFEPSTSALRTPRSPN
jgi:hypothetical protein